MISEECQGPLLYAHGDWGHFDLSSWLGSARPFLQAWGAQQRQPIQSLNVWFLCRYWASGILRTCTPYLVPISSFMYRSTFRLPVSWKTNVLIMILNPYSFISYSISYPFGAFVPIKHPSFAGFIQFPLWSCRERIVTGMALESCNWEGKSHLGSLLKVNPHMAISLVKLYFHTRDVVIAVAWSLSFSFNPNLHCRL